MDLLTLSIGTGLVVALLFAEVYGFKAGGLVVPGYFALFLTDPFKIGATLLVAVLTFLCVRLVASVVIVYGKRRTALAILLGYILGISARLVLGNIGTVDPATGASLFGGEIEVIGYIIPGLIALWMDRQGVIETTTSLLTVSVVTRLVLILLMPTSMETFEAKLHPRPVSAANAALEGDTTTDQ